MTPARLGVLLLLFAGTLAAAAPQVIVDGETFIGKTVADSSVSEFLGVPFAEPPVGALRWEAPQRYVAKSRRHNADHFAPACMQSRRLLEWYRNLAELAGTTRDVVPDLEVSEDCLYLNIWTPAVAGASALPVMVFIHGGSNNSGWAFEPNYRGDRLAKRGVVVVTIAYRLGDFGFFAHPDLTDGGAIANFGLWDQVAALEWLQRNVGKFGGDANRVTLFGESAGAQDIVALLHARRADRLFHRAILQSPAGFGLEDAPSLEDERGRGMRLATALGEGAALTIDEMRELPARELLGASTENDGDYYHSPVIDGILIERPVAQRLEDANYPARPIIVGTNANEWYADVTADADRAFLERTAKDLFPRRFAEALSGIASAPDERHAADRLLTARYMLCPSRHFARAYAGAGGGSAWMYRFSRVREGPVGAAWGAYHGTELPYVFDTHDAWLPTTKTDRRITAQVMSYWLQFAATGNPNPPGAGGWPPFSAAGGKVLQIDDSTGPVTPPDAALCALYEEVLRDR